MKLFKKICLISVVCLTLVFSISFFLSRVVEKTGVEKVVVPNHINLREDLYIIVCEKSQGSQKAVYYKER